MKKITILFLMCFVFAVMLFITGCSSGSGSGSFSVSGNPYVQPSPSSGSDPVVTTQPVADSNTVSGRVVYADGEPIADALVELEYGAKARSLNSSVFASTFSDADGYYSFEDVPLGSYSLSAIVNDNVVFSTNVAVTYDEPAVVEEIVLINYSRVELSIVDQCNSAFLGARLSLSGGVNPISAEITGKTVVIDAVPDGNYLLTIPGYSTDSKPVTVSSSSKGVYQFARAIIPSVTVTLNGLSGDDLNHWFGLLSYGSIVGPSFYSKQLKPVGGVVTYTNVPAGRYSFFHYNDYELYPNKYFKYDLDITTSNPNVQLAATLTYHHRVRITDSASLPVLFAQAVIKDSSTGDVVAEPLSYDDGYIYFSLPNGNYLVSVPSVSTQELPITVSGQNINGYEKGTAQLEFSRSQNADFRAQIFANDGSLSQIQIFYAIRIAALKPSMVQGSTYVLTYDAGTKNWAANGAMDSGLYILSDGTSTFTMFVSPDSENVFVFSR